MPAAAKCTDCWLEPHWRSMVTPVTVSGQPAVSAAVRPMSKVCSPTWPTQPQITSSISAGSTPERSTRLVRTCADRSAGCTPDSPPLRLPTGVRTASTITASCMSCPFRWMPSPYGAVAYPEYGDCEDSSTPVAWFRTLGPSDEVPAGPVDSELD